MEKQLLKDPEIVPTDETLQSLPDGLYPVYNELMQTVTTGDLSLTYQWRYYNDGKAWLCKVVNKKKTVFWLSIWEGCVKVSLFFTEKNCAGIADLPIAEKIKEDFSRAKTIGRLIPLIMDIDSKDKLPDLLAVIRYKKSLK